MIMNFDVVIFLNDALFHVALFGNKNVCQNAHPQ